MADVKPPPGSQQARANGCVCPVIDNRYGSGLGGDGQRFGWVVPDHCPLHDASDAAPRLEDRITLVGCDVSAWDVDPEVPR